MITKCPKSAVAVDAAAGAAVDAAAAAAVDAAAAADRLVSGNGGVHRSSWSKGR